MRLPEAFKFDSGLIHKSIQKRSGKQETPNRLVCLEFPPSASVRPLGLHENVFSSAQYSTVAFSKIWRVIVDKERSV